ncbi:torsin-1A-like, partial [Oncorhynchus tshawytscha]|uniref:torsin-1A-like n=1 Tax=Oncorhynchus tshawytscha TaxID=74940 RepID=UPI001C3DF4D3
CVAHLHSNTGGDKIVQVALDFWRAGRDRDGAEGFGNTALLVQQQIKLHVSNVKISPFCVYNPGIRKQGFLDLKYKIPFLFCPSLFLFPNPSHLMCDMVEMAAKGLKPNQEVANQSAREMIYFPKTEKLFSVKGCKTISSKLDQCTALQSAAAE